MFHFFHTLQASNIILNLGQHGFDYDWLNYIKMLKKEGKIKEEAKVLRDYNI